MRCLLRPVAADRHAAPPPYATACVVGKKQRARVAVAGLHVGEILGTDKLCQRLPDRQQQRLGGPPPARRLKLERPVPAAGPETDPAERLIALEQPVQWLQLHQGLRRQSTPLVLA